MSRQRFMSNLFSNSLDYSKITIFGCLTKKIVFSYLSQPTWTYKMNQLFFSLHLLAYMWRIDQFIKITSRFDRWLVLCWEGNVKIKDLYLFSEECSLLHKLPASKPGRCLTLKQAHDHDRERMMNLACNGLISKWFAGLNTRCTSLLYNGITWHIYFFWVSKYNYADQGYHFCSFDLVKV